MLSNFLLLVSIVALILDIFLVYLVYKYLQKGIRFFDNYEQDRIQFQAMIKHICKNNSEKDG